MFEKMIYYWNKNPDGTIHVQNAVMGYLGQHHVHTVDGFEDWKKCADDIAQECVELTDTVCDCGLKPGEVKSGL